MTIALRRHPAEPHATSSAGQAPLVRDRTREPGPRPLSRTPQTAGVDSRPPPLGAPVCSRAKRDHHFRLPMTGTRDDDYCETNEAPYRRDPGEWAPGRPRPTHVGQLHLGRSLRRPASGRSNDAVGRSRITAVHAGGGAVTTRPFPRTPNLALRRARQSMRLSQAQFAEAVRAAGNAMGAAIPRPRTGTGTPRSVPPKAPWMRLCSPSA